MRAARNNVWIHTACSGSRNRVLLGLLLTCHLATAGTYTLKSKIYGGTFDGFAQRLTITAGDIDGDGDTDVIGGYAQGGLVYLQNPETHLYIKPPTVTVMTGDAFTLEAINNTGDISWSFVQNGSGGSIVSNTGEYVAGPVGGVLDCVEGVDAAGLHGRSYINVISPEDAARSGKAIVIAGRASSTDPVWPFTRYMANLGYNTLRYKGYSRENIRYLSPVPGEDVDGDGQDNDIGGTSTWDNVAHTFTNWVSNAGPLFVHLVDHGGESGGMGYFRLNAQESLSALELDGWLDAIQNRYTNEVVVLIECCNSGSFLPQLAYDGPATRVVIASCSADEVATFAAGGQVSFSEAFFVGLMWGQSVGQAFTFAKDAMSGYQSALLDDNGDGLSTQSDGGVADTFWIGASFVVGKDAPQIEGVMPVQQLSGNAVATLWAENVVSSFPVNRVWCLVVPPSHQPDPDNPVIDLPQLDLTYNSATRRYEAQYAGFSEEGTYKIVYYAKDIWGSVSLPKQSYVVQSGFMERAVIVAGGSTNDAQWAAVNTVADYAFHVFMQRRLSTNAVHYLSQGLNENVSGLSSRSELANTVTNWAAGYDKLTLYLVAASAGPDGSFRLNGQETITASDVDALLDAYQVSNATVTVILDCEGAGAWLPALAAPNRVVVASTQESRPAIFLNGGLLSFSWCFYSTILNGANVWDAFAAASKMIRLPGGRKQTPQLDSDGDGRFVAGLDKIIAQELFLGSAFMTGADIPTIDAVTPDTVMTEPGGLTLWASGVADIGGVSNVFCLISAPGADPLADAFLVELMWNPSVERYEVAFDGFDTGGTYACTYFVTDAEGQLSAPAQTLVEVTSEDAYEPDNTALQAALFEIGTAQTHNRHTADDEDWVTFYAPSGYVFNVQATQLGVNSDLRLEVYFQNPDGTLNYLDESDWELDGEGLSESVEIYLAGAYQDEPGFYCVRVVSANAELWGAGSEYELEIYSAQGADEALIVVAVDKLGSALPPAGATVAWDGTNFLSFGSANSLLLSMPEGVHTVEVTVAAGYLAEQDPALAGQVANPESYWYGNPKRAVSVSGSPRMAVFQFVPVTTVRGRVMDRFTGEPVAGAGLAFEAVGGPLNGKTFSGYPNSASYKSVWVTGADGAFPTNVWLPTAQWGLTVSCTSYTNLTCDPAVEQMSAGSVTNLGTLLLSPLDLDGNGVADGWEAQYGLTNVTGSSDADSDAFPDRSEYLAGTDPTNSLSVFQILEMIKSPAAECGLRWNANGGRSFRVFWSDALGLWSAEQSIMVGPTNAWCDPADPKPAARFYRVEVELP